MKTNNLFGILLLFFCTVGLTNCNSYLLSPDGNDPEVKEGEEWLNSIPDGNFFGRANTLRLYYIDENGNSLINPDDPNTYPVSWSENLENPIERTNDRDASLSSTSNIIIAYNGNHNWIYFDEEENLYYCTLGAYGDARYSIYTFPIYVNGDTDQLEITYMYTTKDVIGGSYYAKITSWKYNGTHIYSDNDGYDKKVFIRKANGNTTVSFTR